MENRRFILICLLGVILFFIWQAWDKEQQARRAPPPVVTAPLPEERHDDIPGLGAAPAPAADPAARADDDAPAALAPVVSDDARIRVVTDVYEVDIGLLGGDLRRAELLGYPVAKDQQDVDVALLTDTLPNWFVIQSGLAGRDEPLVSQYTRYRAPHTRYELAPGADELEVVLEADGAAGTLVRKVFRFQRNSYRIQLRHELVNDGEQPLETSHYVQMWRTPFSLGDEPPFIRTFLGYGVYEQRNGGNGYRFRKIKLDEVSDKAFEIQQSGGWMTMMQHYFLAAVIPPSDQPATFAGQPSRTRGFLGQYVGPAVSVAPGDEHVFETLLYVGPKLQARLGDVAPGFDLTIDYGILTPISAPLFWVLAQFHKLTGNWGWAIVLLTLAVKLAMYKLSEAQYRSMAKMRRFAPRIQDLKERFGDDRQRMQKAMMDLYKKEKFNPLGGCWPLLVQFPVFIALYWVLLESVELRQANFLLWLNDLSAPDPYFVLPVLFGISMFLQMRLSGTSMTMDPMQQRIMNAMPIMLTAFFAFFPVGLVLYWLVSNLIGIAQQWYIFRKLDKEGLGFERKKT